MPHMTTQMKIAIVKIHFACKSRSNASRIKEQNVPRSTQLTTNLAYILKPHHTRNLYLTARFDTCTDVNLMPASMYQLVFNDAKMQKLAPSKLQVGTYTTDTVKIVESCTFYLVHPDTKKLIEVTFYVAMNDGSVLLSCKTTLLLGLIQPRPRLDYLSPRASLITSSADHPKKTKAVLHTQKQEVSAQTTKQEMATQTSAAKRQVSKLITNKEMILHEYPDAFEGIGKLPGPDYHIQIDPKYTSKANTLLTNPYTLKREVSNKK